MVHVTTRTRAVQEQHQVPASLDFQSDQMRTLDDIKREES